MSVAKLMAPYTHGTYTRRNKRTYFPSDGQGAIPLTSANFTSSCLRLRVKIHEKSLSQARAVAITNWLVAQDCKLVVVACNTATTNAGLAPNHGAERLRVESVEMR